jgi:tripartite-type tricarboxylate transporter receptor subunit TctC
MNSQLVRRLLLGLAASILVSPVFAQTYPNRPIQLVVPYSPGGPTDVAARVMAQRMS